MLFILPTKELLETYRDYYGLFNFYHNGIKGLVSDIIYSNGSLSFYDKIINEYTNSSDGKLISMFDNESKLEVFDLLIDNIADDLNEILNKIFGKLIYTIKPDNHIWLENDICIQVIFISNGKYN